MQTEEEGKETWKKEEKGVVPSLSCGSREREGGNGKDSIEGRRGRGGGGEVTQEKQGKTVNRRRRSRRAVSSLQPLLCYWGCFGGH